MWTARGLVTHYVLFVIDHASRLVEIVGVTDHPDAAFMAQVARNLTSVDGTLRDRRYLIVDRDSKFTTPFRRVREQAGVEVVQSIKRECLQRLILFGSSHLRRALQEFVAHYRLERPHQGLGNKVLTPIASEPAKEREVVADERLGGLLRSYRYSA